VRLVQGSDNANDDDQHPSFRPPFPPFPPFDHGSDVLNHPLIQKTPKVSGRQRVDVSEPTTNMAKMILTRTLPSVEAV
jgi:hypothetical protein